MAEQEEEYEGNDGSKDASAQPAGSHRSDDIFSLFEPPPEIDPNKFGPVPVVNAEVSPSDPVVVTFKK